MPINVSVAKIGNYELESIMNERERAAFIRGFYEGEVAGYEQGRSAASDRLDIAFVTPTAMTFTREDLQRLARRLRWKPVLA